MKKHFLIVPDYPWGKLPVLQIDDKILTQSKAIMRYLAKKYGLNGADYWEDAKMDEISDALTDLQAGINNSVVNKLLSQNCKILMQWQIACFDLQTGVNFLWNRTK